MREIKFRVWDRRIEKMGEVTEIRFSRVQHNLVKYRYTDDRGKVIDEQSHFDKGFSNGLDIMQYTGLKNHKGTEIYEGDIVHARGHYAGEGWFDTGEHEYNFKDEVKWDNDKLAFVCGGYYLHEINIIKIVGNRHQNPEQLKE